MDGSSTDCSSLSEFHFIRSDAEQETTRYSEDTLQALGMFELCNILI